MENQKRPYEMIEDIIKDFDYKKVHSVMVFLGWKWSGHTFIQYGETNDGTFIPNIDMLTKASLKMMFKAVDDVEKDVKETSQYYTASGGFRVSVFKENKIINYINLEFILTDWSAFIDDK